MKEIYISRRKSTSQFLVGTSSCDGKAEQLKAEQLSCIIYLFFFMAI